MGRYPTRGDANGSDGSQLDTDEPSADGVYGAPAAPASGGVYGATSSGGVYGACTGGVCGAVTSGVAGTDGVGTTKSGLMKILSPTCIDDTATSGHGIVPCNHEVEDALCDTSCSGVKEQLPLPSPFPPLLKCFASCEVYESAILELDWNSTGTR